VYATAMLITAWSPWDWPLYPALVCAGAAWMAPMSTFNTATQTSVPPWVRARAAALHTVSALGSFAIGSALWGALADLFTLPAALTLAAIAMLAGLLLAKPFPLRMGEAEEVTQAEAWEKLFITNEPSPEKGPIAVENVYRIDPAEAIAFIDAISEMRAIRRRDGATLWRVYSDLADPTRYVERYVVESWAGYLHQQARMTVADQEVEARVKTFQAEGVPVITQHFLAEG
jgi:MFS family permease